MEDEMIFSKDKVYVAIKDFLGEIIGYEVSDIEPLPRLTQE